jgi:hypothetical protein
MSVKQARASRTPAIRPRRRQDEARKAFEVTRAPALHPTACGNFAHCAAILFGHRLKIFRSRLQSKEFALAYLTSPGKYPTVAISRHFQRFGSRPGRDDE